MSEKLNIDYGPLTELIGVWKGHKGMDIAPESDGTEENPYYETITFTEGGTVDNAESQTLSILFYRQIVKRKSNDEKEHPASTRQRGVRPGPPGGGRGQPLCGLSR